MTFLICDPENPSETPWVGWVKFFLAENESHIYPNMCAKFGRGPTVVSKGGGGTDRQTTGRCGYILDNTAPCIA